MDPHQYIKKEWIVSPAARRVFRASAGISLTLYLSLGWGLVSGGIPLLRQFLFIGLLAMGVTAAGMEAFLFFFDDSPAWKQILWFLVMVFPPLGPALYCFVVYSRLTAIKAASGVEENALLMKIKS